MAEPAAPPNEDVRAALFKLKGQATKYRKDVEAAEAGLVLLRSTLAEKEEAIVQQEELLRVAHAKAAAELGGTAESRAARTSVKTVWDESVEGLARRADAMATAITEEAAKRRRLDPNVNVSELDPTAHRQRLAKALEEAESARAALDQLAAGCGLSTPMDASSVLDAD